MNNRIDLYNDAKSVLVLIRDRKITAYRVSKETGVKEYSLNRVAEGTSDLKNISFDTALGLLQFKKNHPELFEEDN